MIATYFVCSLWLEINYFNAFVATANFMAQLRMSVHNAIALCLNFDKNIVQ